MFEIGFTELILIAIVGLLVIGPERLPEALRTLGLWVGRLRRSFANVKAEIEKEIGMDEIRRQLHNEAVMEEMKRIERDVRDSVHASTAPPEGVEPVASGKQTADAEQAPESPAESVIAPSAAAPAAPTADAGPSAGAESSSDRTRERESGAGEQRRG